MTDHTPELDSVREAFERWEASRGGNLTRHPSGLYANSTMQGRWTTWQAAHAAAQSRIASLEAERDEWHDRATEAQAERDAAREERDEARARVAQARQLALADAITACEAESLEEPQAGTEDLAYDMAVRDCANAVRAILTNERESNRSAASTANQAACRQQNAIHEPQAGLSLTDEPAGAEGQTL